MFCCAGICCGFDNPWIRVAVHDGKGPTEQEDTRKEEEDGTDRLSKCDSSTSILMNVKNPPLSKGNSLNKNTNTESTSLTLCQQEQQQPQSSPDEKKKKSTIVSSSNRNKTVFCGVATLCASCEKPLHQSLLCGQFLMTDTFVCHPCYHMQSNKSSKRRKLRTSLDANQLSLSSSSSRAPAMLYYYNNQETTRDTCQKSQLADPPFVVNQEEQPSSLAKSPLLRCWSQSNQQQQEKEESNNHTTNPLPGKKGERIDSTLHWTGTVVASWFPKGGKYDGFQQGLAPCNSSTTIMTQYSHLNNNSSNRHNKKRPRTTLLSSLWDQVVQPMSLNKYKSGRHHDPIGIRPPFPKQPWKRRKRIREQVTQATEMAQAAVASLGSSTVVATQDYDAPVAAQRRKWNEMNKIRGSQLLFSHHQSSSSLLSSFDRRHGRPKQHTTRLEDKEEQQQQQSVTRWFHVTRDTTTTRATATNLVETCNSKKRTLSNAFGLSSLFGSGNDETTTPDEKQHSLKRRRLLPK